MPSSQERARAKFTSLFPYPKTLQVGNYHHHGLHPLLPCPYLLCLTPRLLRESGHGWRVGDRHHIYPAFSHHSLSRGHLSNPNPSLSLRLASHPPPQRSFFHQKSSQQRPSLEYHPLTLRTIQPSFHTHFPTLRPPPSGIY